MSGESTSSQRPSADPTQRFTGRAGGYDQHRPTYPSAAIDAVLSGLGGSGPIVAADIGAGTGISSRLLAERGVRVIAVEPNRSMLEFGASRGDALIEWRCATGEATGLGHGSVDVVLCAQAFHWLDHARALAEFARVLRVGGRAAVVWNVHDEADGFTAAYRAVVARHALESPRSPSFTGHEKTPRFEGAAWRDARSLVFAHEQSLDAAGLVGRAASSSYCAAEGDGHAALARDLDALHARWAREGVVRIRYQTRVYVAERG